jgi:CelD/BcsL family acetyltransferase involved in cellulose biosynthesis
MALQLAATVVMTDREHSNSRDALRIETLTSFDQAQSIANEWDSLIKQLNGSLYMSFNWCRVWWRHYGTGRELRLFVIRRGQTLAGVLPMFIDRVGLPLFRAKVAKLVGCDFTIAMVNPLIEPEVAREAFSEIISNLINHDRCDIVHAGPISASIPHLECLRQAAAKLSESVAVLRDCETGSHTVFEVPNSFDAYIQGLSKNQRSNYRRNINKLNNAFKFEVDVVRNGPELEREFDAFVDMHQSQWQAVNKLGHFGDWPKSLEFTRELVQALAGQNGIRLIRMIADGQVVSYYFCFELNGTFYWRLPGRLVGEHWDQYALGRVGLFKMLEVAALEGATAIEAGNGYYEYKEKLNAKTFPLCTFAVCQNRLASRAKARLAIVFGDILNLAYYRLWFSRIAPRLGIPLGQLWQIWIRNRL